MPTARFLLRWLVVTSGELVNDDLDTSFNLLEWSAVARWLTRQELGALAYGHTLAYWRSSDAISKLRNCLQGDMFSATAESSLKQASLHAILSAFADAEIPLVLLKGAALGLTVYDDPAQRTMSDIDIWVQDADMGAAAQVMMGLGYETNLKGERPFELQQMARGEIELILPTFHAGLVDFHWSPFPGWWLKRTAMVDETALWVRREPLGDGLGSCQLSPEDMVIHLTVHMAINHQFDVLALRGLVDIALTAKKRGVDWAVVGERAREWRVGTAVYTVLDLLNQLIGVDGLELALNRLRPSTWRRKLIYRFVTPESVLAGQDITSGWQRFLLLLLLVDRKRDMAKLVGRTLWPEKEWLEARYGGNVGHWKHLWRVVRSGEV